MNMVEVRPSFGGANVITYCIRCQHRIDGRVEKIYADLDGEPWKAYYCAACVYSAMLPVKGEVSK